MAATKRSRSSEKGHAEKSGKGKVENDNIIDKHTAKSPVPYSLGAIVNVLIACTALIAGILTPRFMLIYMSDSASIQVGEETNPTIVKKKGSNFVECGEDNLAQFIHDKRTDGMHIFCFDSIEDSGDRLLMFKNMHDELRVRFDEAEDPQRAVTRIVRDIVEPHHVTNTQPWAFFSTKGERLLGELDNFIPKGFNRLQKHGMVILMEGGNWLWPGVRIGFKRQVDLLTGYTGTGTSKSSPETQTLEVETLSIIPLVLSVKKFISESECDHIQDLATPNIQYSEVVLMDQDKGKPSSDFRTSQSTFLQAQEEIMYAMEARTASITRIPRQHQEHTQVLRYGKTEKYSAHVDYFDPAYYQQDRHTLSLIENGKRNRLATVFWYLSDVEEGGHTVFPRFGGAPQPRSFDDCTLGLRVKPEKGKVIIFYSLKPDGRRDETSLHGACPVGRGIKWAANKWVWNTPMGYL
mmetsp:Transcript_15900/g.23249  ORF Transcript_15900/g.23249 Transcript_15900/m.23249 type:complete len:464 (+) Transcript_15900:3-1394(+)